MNNYFGKFEDISYSEIVLGDRFLTKNCIDRQTGAVDINHFQNIVGELFTEQPVWASASATGECLRVVILAGGTSGWLLNCLEALATQRTKKKLLPIVIPFYGLIEHADCLKKIPWLEVSDSHLLGYPALVNVFQESASESLIVLHQYERLVPDAIDELVQTIEIQEEAAIIACKVIGDDYSLVECGGRCFLDTGPISFGYDDDPNKSSYCYAHKINFASGCFLLKKSCLKRIEEKLSLSSELDSLNLISLFLELQNADFSIVVQPLARTVSFGRKLGFPGCTKDALAESCFKHMKMWRAFYNGKQCEDDFTAAAPSGHILFIDFAIPDPQSDAGSVTILNLLRTFLKLGWRVSLLPTILNKYCDRTVRVLARLGIEIFYSNEVDSLAGVQQRYEASISHIFGVRVAVMASLFDEVRLRFPLAPISFFNCDLHFLRESREAQLKKDWHIEGNACFTKRDEIGCFLKADSSIVHTDIEYKIVQKIVELDNMHILPFAATIRESTASFEERNDIMFLGGYDHAPNVEAVVYLVNEIWPLISNELPQKAKLILAGANPPDEVRALANKNIIVTGRIPKLEPYFDRARVFVAPLQFGSGVKGKLITAFAQGLPSVVSSIAAEGIRIDDGDAALIADDAKTFATKIMRLYQDKSLWQSVQQQAYDFVRNNSQVSSYVDICLEMIQSARATWKKREDESVRAIVNEFIEKKS